MYDLLLSIVCLSGSTSNLSAAQQKADRGSAESTPGTGTLFPYPVAQRKQEQSYYHPFAPSFCYYQCSNTAEDCLLGLLFRLASILIRRKAMLIHSGKRQSAWKRDHHCIEGVSHFSELFNIQQCIP